MKLFYIKINKPFLNKNKFEYTSYILNLLVNLPHTSNKILFRSKFSPHLFFLLLFMQMYRAHHYVCLFIIPSPEDGHSWGVKSKWETCGAFLNSFYPKIKRLIRKLERIKDRIGRHKVSVLYNHTHTHIYMVSQYTWTHVTVNYSTNNCGFFFFLFQIWK